MRQLTDDEVAEYQKQYGLIDGEQYLTPGDVRQAWDFSDSGRDAARMAMLCESYAQQARYESVCESGSAAWFEEAAYGLYE